MIKPTSSYKMPKYIKTWLSHYKDPHLRGQMKRSWIQADLESNIKPKADKKNRDSNED
jgi:hypothetical protein